MVALWTQAQCTTFSLKLTFWIQEIKPTKCMFLVDKYEILLIIFLKIPQEGLYT